MQYILVKTPRVLPYLWSRALLYRVGPVASLVAVQDSLAADQLARLFSGLMVLSAPSYTRQPLLDRTAALTDFTALNAPTSLQRSAGVEQGTALPEPSPEDYYPSSEPSSTALLTEYTDLVRRFGACPFDPSESSPLAFAAARTASFLRSYYLSRTDPLSATDWQTLTDRWLSLTL